MSGDEPAKFTRVVSTKDGPVVARNDENLILAEVMREMQDAPPDLLAREAAAHGGDMDAVLRGFVNRRFAEECKADANAPFARGKFEAAMAAYDKLLRAFLAGIAKRKRSPLDKRLVAILRSNMSACSLAMGDVEQAVEEARAAIAEDETCEKAWLRLGTALEASPGKRKDALEAYRRIRSNVVAAERIAVLEAPRVEVTTEGLTGVKGSVDPRSLAPFRNPTRFFGNRIYLPSEPLGPEEARSTTFDYTLRLMMLELAEIVEASDPKSLQNSRHELLSATDANEKLYIDLLGGFVTLPNVADDGRSRKVARNSSDIPILWVALWTGEGKPPFEAPTRKWSGAVFPLDLKRLKAMLLRNAGLLTAHVTGRLAQLVPGFTTTILTHVAAPELDFSVMEGCSMPGCVVECAGFRCGRCVVARYCGKEHMTAHWKVHKPLCVRSLSASPK
jgi:hypothetical protein